MAESKSENRVEQRVRDILRQSLQLDDVEQMNCESLLLGAVPELDSVAAVTIITALEDDFDIVIEDDEIFAETFETFGSLVGFVLTKVMN